MLCPNCQAENDASAEVCFTCRKPLITPTTITQGALVAGRYEILSQLGKGGMGTVYKARDRVLDEVVALKVLRSDIASEPDMERRFRSEIKLARKIRHRNVCGIHEYGEAGQIHFIAMEYIEGTDLRHILKDRGAPPPEEAFEIAIQVAEGLAAIHDEGVIHRDLKTPNIMRDARGVLRLMDFGIAKEHGADGGPSATATGMVMGTPEYMSPEQARGEKVDFRSDIYALGVVIFEVFTGRVPFSGETPIAVILKHLQQPPPLEEAAGLPVALLATLHKALAKNAGDRYQSMGELVDALREARTRSGFTALAPVPRGTSALPEPLPTGAEETRATPVVTYVPTAVPTARQEVSTPTAALPATSVAGESAPEPKTKVLPASAPAALTAAAASGSSAARGLPKWTWAVAGVAAVVVVVLLRGRGAPDPPMASPSASSPGPSLSAPPPETTLARAEPAVASPGPREARSSPLAARAPNASPGPVETPRGAATTPAPVTMASATPVPPPTAAPSIAPPATTLAAPAAPARKSGPIELPASATPPATLPGNPAPEYPREARMKGAEGRVILRIVVSETGEVAGTEVLSGEEPFVTAATDAVKKWRYKPALVDGKATAVYQVVTVPFRLAKR